MTKQKAAARIIWSSMTSLSAIVFPQRAQNHQPIQKYVVAFKGLIFTFCKEPNGGFCELLYDKLARHKNWLSFPIYVFWDKMCLNDGMNWEKGFVKGLLHSRAVVLLISAKVSAIQINDLV
jgi:hypothetical protein